MASRVCGLLWSKGLSRGIRAKALPLSKHEAKRLFLSSKAATNLLSIVNEEISTERKVLEKLPKISSFDITLDGSIATLVRMYGGEEVKVQLNANHTSESDVIEDNDGVYDHDEKDDEEEEYEEREVISPPIFTVSVKNEAGSTLQFDCSFDELGPYNEGIDWSSLRIDTMSVIPTDGGEIESIYSANSSSFSEEFYGGLLEFLSERGINEVFSRQIQEFYPVFEHQCYTNQFLAGIRDFCNGK